MTMKPKIITDFYVSESDKHLSLFVHRVFSDETKSHEYCASTRSRMNFQRRAQRLMFIQIENLRRIDNATRR